MTGHPSGSEEAAAAPDPLGDLQIAVHEKLDGGAQGRAKPTKCAAKTPSKPLKKKESCTSPYGYPKRALQLLQIETFDLSGHREHSSYSTMVIGFDGEWKEAPRKPEDEEDQTGPAPPHNNVLSYQLAGRTSSGHEWAVIVFPRAGQAVLHPDMRPEDLAEIPERVRFMDLIGICISEGIKLGHLKRWPSLPITVAGHWTRTDLTAMADFAAIKSEFDGVHNTYVTASPSWGFYTATTCAGKHSHRLNIRLLDTWLLVPEGSKSLEDLGKIYNYPKLKVGKAPDGRNYIECMDQLLKDNPDLFKRYGIRDAEITARHVDELSRFAWGDLGVGLDGIPCTLSGLSVANLLKKWAELGIDRLAVNGLEIKTLTKWDAVKHKTKYFKAETHVDGYRIHEQLAKDCLHGGRNECFWFGPTPPPQEGVLLNEYDLVSAYATALCSLRIPDYARAFTVDDADAFMADELGFALISYRFPSSTRYPCLPVEGDKGRGLIFSLAGTSWATAPEIVLARKLGAKITVHHGVIIPWVKGSPQIFEPVIKDLMVRREQHPKGSLQNSLYKLLGNGLYGKTCQGLAGNIAFDTRAGVHKEIPESRITNPFLAAHVTGLTRALVGEFMASAAQDPKRTVYSVTTDGFITDASISEISMKGPIASHMMKVRSRLVPEGRPVELLEMNYQAQQLLFWRTRGVATIARPDGTNAKLARGGMQAPRGVEPNEWFVRKMLERGPFETFTSKEKSSFPDAHRANEDFSMRDKEKAINFEPDFKRELSNPRLIDVELPNGDRFQHLACGTRPWNTVEEFNATRDRHEQWRARRSKGGHDRQLKTLEDWDHWVQFKAGTLGIVDRALRLVIRAYAKLSRPWGLPGGNYRDAAEKLKAAGFAWVKAQTFKDALRGKPPAENTIPANAPGMRELVLTLLDIWPSFEWRRLVLDPPERWLEGCDIPLRQPAQNDEFAQAKWPREPQETWKVAPAPTRTQREPCNLQLPPPPEDASVVPLRPVLKPKFAPPRIA